MDLLDNPLIRKYFGDEDTNNPCTPAGIAWNVLRAMQEPIKKGDWYLWCDGNEDTKERVWRDPLPGRFEENFHPHYLRLPDRFQKQEQKCNESCVCYEKKPTPEPRIHPYVWKGSEPEKCFCGNNVDAQTGKCKPKDEVEEKIKAIMYHCSSHIAENQLRELVALARKI